MRTLTALLGLVVLTACQPQPSNCTYHHTEPGGFARFIFMPPADVYKCDGNTWIRKEPHR